MGFLMSLFGVYGCMVEEVVIDLGERVRMIIELWDEGEPLDLDRLAEIASNLYGASRDSVVDAVISDLRKGKISGQFYAPG